MSAPCVFCGSPLVERTREHVIPRWLSEEMGLSSDLILPTHFSERGEVLSDRLHPVDKYLCGRVCHSCNSGWMSTLETANQTFIRDLIHGRTDTLDLSDAEAGTLAVWALKTALALHAASNYRRIVPEEHYRLIAKRQIVPTSVWVVGKTWHACSGFSWAQSPAWAVIEHGRELTTPERDRLKSEAYKICLQIGRLLLLVAYNPLPATQCCLWQFVHVPLHPRHGPVSWLKREPSLPEDDPVKACFAFHASLGLVTLAEGGPSAYVI